MTSAIFHRHTQFQQTIFPEKSHVAQFLLKASWYAQTLLVSSGISDGKLGPSLFAIIHAEGQIFPHQHTESIFSVHYAWDLLQLASDSRSPASPVSAAGPGTTSSLPLGAALCQALGSRQVDGASRHPCSQLLLKARLHRAGCSHQEPCPVWKQSPSLGPSLGSDHPHWDFFSPLLIRW